MYLAVLNHLILQVHYLVLLVLHLLVRQCFYNTQLTCSLMQFLFSESSINSTNTDSCEKLKDDILDACTCGRLLDCNINRPPCQFCIDQMTILDQLITQQKSDYLMAKNLEDSFRKENFDEYNLRKRPNPRQSSERKKIMKLSKGQLTLKQVYKNV